MHLVDSSLGGFSDDTPLEVRAVVLEGTNRWWAGGDKAEWLLTAPLKYTGDAAAKYESPDFIVPKRTQTDFASVPRLFQWLVPATGRYSRATVLHDWLCKKEGFPRRHADGLFRRAMADLKVPTIRRYVMWAAVRVGGVRHPRRNGILKELRTIPGAMQWAGVAGTLLAFLAWVGAFILLFAVAGSFLLLVTPSWVQYVVVGLIFSPVIIVALVFWVLLSLWLAEWLLYLGKRIRGGKPLKSAPAPWW